jgi:hypothetical protein
MILTGDSPILVFVFSQQQAMVIFGLDIITGMHVIT